MAKLVEVLVDYCQTSQHRSTGVLSRILNLIPKLVKLSKLAAVVRLLPLMDTWTLAVATDFVSEP